MKWERTLERIAADASKLSPAKVAFTLLSLPFYLFGLVVGAVWLVLVLAYSAVVVGFDAGRRARLGNFEQDE